MVKLRITLSKKGTVQHFKRLQSMSCQARVPLLAGRIGTGARSGTRFFTLVDLRVTFQSPQHLISSVRDSPPILFGNGNWLANLASGAVREQSSLRPGRSFVRNSPTICAVDRCRLVRCGPEPESHRRPGRFQARNETQSRRFEPLRPLANHPPPSGWACEKAVRLHGSR